MKNYRKIYAEPRFFDKIDNPVYSSICFAVYNKHKAIVFDCRVYWNDQSSIHFIQPSPLSFCLKNKDLAHTDAIEIKNGKKIYYQQDINLSETERLFKGMMINGDEWLMDELEKLLNDYTYNNNNKLDN